MIVANQELHDIVVHFFRHPAVIWTGLHLLMFLVREPEKSENFVSPINGLVPYRVNQELSQT